MRDGIEVSWYEYGPAPESDGVREWLCRYWAHADPARSSECERCQKHGAGYICDACAKRDAARTGEVRRWV